MVAISGRGRQIGHALQVDQFGCLVRLKRFLALGLMLCCKTSGGKCRVGNHGGVSVDFEYTLPDGTRTDCVLCDHRGRPLAVLEAKRTSLDPVAARRQGLDHAAQLGVPLSCSRTASGIMSMDRDVDAYARDIATIF
jgi:hypothetical protein